MKRLIDWHLRAWREEKRRKPLLLRGARQTGKTYSVRELGKHFESFVEVNFELTPEAKTIFERDLQPERILWELGLLANTPIKPGTTLLFLDEVQAAPQAILALRYFYELVPDLHVIAAGSLVDFALEKVGMPVGRVSMFYVYPLCFMEFLAATNNDQFIKAILDQMPLSEILHDKLMDLLGHYLAIGGMPEAVRAWIDTKDPRASYEAQRGLAETYLQDFPKYAKKHQLPYLDVLFSQIPHFIGKQFKYSAVHGEYKKRELAPCLNLLCRANVIHQITHSAANGLPLGAEVNLERFKIIFLDVGIAQALLGIDLTSWFLNPDKDLVNRGPLAEAFVGQELLAYASPKSKRELHFWKRESAGSLAEVDYVYDYQHSIAPIEVKSGHGSTLRSMHQFLEEHKKVKTGFRFWSENYLASGSIESRPLYSVATLAHPDQKEALLSLVLTSTSG
ncbi:MAG: ATP-binding protein [Verrucomicrobia bacterium]|nr:ATP-binding protein [Verrucomicrobiota bacterium]